MADNNNNSHIMRKDFAQDGKISIVGKR